MAFCARSKTLVLIEGHNLKELVLGFGVLCSLCYQLGIDVT
jgi:hypothetical protein